MCLGVVLFGSLLFGTLCASWTCMSTAINKLGNFSFIIFSNRFPILCSSSSPSGTLMIHILIRLKISQRSPSLSSFFKILFPCCCFDWILFHSLYSKSLIWLLALPPPLLVPYRFFFISLNVTFISAWVFFMLWQYRMISLSILITGILNSAFHRLLISISFRFFFSLSFVLFFHLGHISLSPQLAASLCLFLCTRSSCFEPCLSSVAYYRKVTCKLCGMEP